MIRGVVDRSRWQAARRRVGLARIRASRTCSRGSDTKRGESRMVTVEARDDGDGDPASIPPVLTDANGQVRDRRTCRAFHGRSSPRRRRQAARPRDRASCPMRRSRSRRSGVTELSGTVHAPARPAVVFTVELEGPTRAQRSFATADGTFSFGARRSGRLHGQRHVDRRQRRGGTSRWIPASPRPSRSSSPRNAIVIGKLVDPAGKPLGGLPVAVIPDASDGSLRIELSGPPPMSGPDGTSGSKPRPARARSWS